MKHTLAIPLLLMFAAIQGWAQTDSSQSSNQAPYHPTVNGDSGSLAFSGEAERVNLLSGGVSLSSTYDDNALSTPGDKVGNVGYQVNPSLSIVEARAQTLFTLNYNPGFLWNERLPQRYMADHNLDFNFQYRLTESLSVRVHDQLIDQSTSFNALNQNSLLPGGNVLTAPNQSITTPLTTQFTNVTNVDLVDRVGEGTNIGVSGSFNKLNFSDTSTSPVQLYDNEAWSGDAFFSHRLSERHTIGVTYTFQKISTFGEILEHTESQSVLLFYTLTIKPGMTLSVFAGPDHSITNDQFLYSLGPVSVPINQTEAMWLVDEGATFAWQGQQTSARINLIHHVADGGGLTGAVQLYSGTAGLRRQISKTWTGDFDLTYGKNNPLSHYFGNAFSGFGGTVGLSKTFGEHFTVGTRYGRSFQRFEDYGVTTPSSGFSANHNQGWITVTYRFSRPLG
jgi:hypothetical protein